MASKSNGGNGGNGGAVGAEAKVVIRQASAFVLGFEIDGGDVPILQNCFSQKIAEQILRKQMGIAAERGKKIPRELIEDATVRNVAGEVCISPVAIKKGMVAAASGMRGVRKTQLNVSVYVLGGSIPITYESWIPRMDMVRTGGMSRAPDIRFRPQFNGWKARLRIAYSEGIAAQTIVDLLQRAGRGGVCEWRPQKGGTFGTYSISRVISDPEELAEVERICAPQLVPLKVPPDVLDVELTDDTIKAILAAGSETPKKSGRKTKGTKDDADRAG